MNDIEYNFIQNQIEANNKVRSILQYEITSLLGIVRQKKLWIDQLDENDKELNLRLGGMANKDKKIVKYYNDLL